MGMSMAFSRQPAPAPTRSLPGLETGPQYVVRLFCFPYAGAGASIYRTWASALPKSVNVCPVQLPGREGRINEAPFTEMAALIPALAQEMLPALDRAFAFFGHSMGALISFELARHLRRAYGLQPSRLFISGRGAPRTRGERRPSPPVTSAALHDYARRLKKSYGGALVDAELRNLLLPILRADLAVCDSYSYTADEPLDCPFSVFSGAQERGLDERGLAGWRELTTAAVSTQTFPGDHFFLNSARPELLEAVSSELDGIISSYRLKNSGAIFAPRPNP
jgi:medium-chain acyl-[acyl-carrier-protein] hydrolase